MKLMNRFAYTKSKSTFSVFDSLVNNFVVSVDCDGLSSKSSDILNHVVEVVLSVAILELFVDVSHIINIKLTFSLAIK